MKEVTLSDLAPHELGPTVLTIGNFDGVHRGHQAILQRLRTAAAQRSRPAAAITFAPHPVQFLHPEKNMRLIVPFTERARLLQRYGVEVLVTLPFNEQTARTPAEDWVREVLVEQLNAQQLFIGYDFSFGRGRDGNAQHLAVLGEKYGFAVEQLNAVFEDGRPISSSRIRRLIEAGEVSMAKKLLGRPFHLRGAVVRGSGRGRNLGFPTANLDTTWELLPHIGVYAAVAEVDGKLHAAAVSMGKNPTFDLHELRLETYLLDFAGDLYGKEICLHFVRRLRDEKKFERVEQLIEAMERDVAHTRKLFREQPPALWLT